VRLLIGKIGSRAPRGHGCRDSAGGDPGSRPGPSACAGSDDAGARRSGTCACRFGTCSSARPSAESGAGGSGPRA